VISVSVSASVRDHMHISGTRRPIFVECMLSVDVATSTVAALRYVTSFRFISHRNPNSRMTVFMHFYVVSKTHFLVFPLVIPQRMLPKANRYTT